jgi:hypothetical protein
MDVDEHERLSNILYTWTHNPKNKGQRFYCCSAFQSQPVIQQQV